MSCVGLVIAYCAYCLLKAVFGVRAEGGSAASWQLLGLQVLVALAAAGAYWWIAQPWPGEIALDWEGPGRMSHAALDAMYKAQLVGRSAERFRNLAGFVVPAGVLIAQDLIWARFRRVEDRAYWLGGRLGSGQRTAQHPGVTTL